MNGIEWSFFYELRLVCKSKKIKSPTLDHFNDSFHVSSAVIAIDCETRKSVVDCC